MTPPRALSAPPPCTGALLAGGRSRRFGSDKALAPWGSGRVIDAVAAALKAACPEVVLVTNRPEAFRDLGLRCVPDRHPGAGPLAGLQAALAAARHPRVFLAACDMPLIDPGIIRWLTGLPTWAPVVIPWLERGPEPLHAVYHRSLLPLVGGRLAAGRRSLRELVEMVPHRRVRPEEFPADPTRLQAVLGNANTPAELERLRRLAAAP
ncbi:molybdenum cofactor guanylyltransferase [Dissulfurirhabdus thermomarina]|nr:molybdenum cofactor guanylyltransferase [Dissulfurirhabdus thermomarina]